MKTWLLYELRQHLLDDQCGPYQNIYLQESELINTIINLLIVDLEDLEFAFKGEHTMTGYMEKLMEVIELNRIAQLQRISWTVRPNSWTLWRYAAKLQPNGSTLKGHLIIEKNQTILAKDETIAANGSTETIQERVTIKWLHHIRTKYHLLMFAWIKKESENNFIITYFKHLSILFYYCKV